MEQEKVVRVSDGSQKYKIGIALFLGGFFVALGYKVIALLQEIVELLKGIEALL